MSRMHMDPNSANQRWSKWTITVSTTRQIHRDDPTVRSNVARFMSKAFGSASQMRITKQSNGLWVFQIRSEGHPVHDPTYVSFLASNFQKFFIAGFGVGTKVSVTAKLEAGSAQNGRPADQLVILPSIHGLL